MIFVEDFSDDLLVPTTLKTFYETLPEAQRTQGTEKEKKGVLDFDIFIVVTIEKTIKLD